MAAEEPALTRPIDPDDIGKVATFDGTDVVWATPAGGGGGGTPGLVGDLSAIEIGDAAAAGATGRYADAAHQHALAAPAAPAALGASAATGAATAPARADHVHPYPTAAQVGAATSGHVHSGVYDPAGTAAATVASHEADTTSVHGIADTAALLDIADIGVSVQAHAAVLDATTASFTTADETKLDGIEALADVTDESNVVAALSGATLTDLGAPASGDKILLLDASDSDNLKTAAFSTFGGGTTIAAPIVATRMATGSVWNWLTRGNDRSTRSFASGYATAYPFVLANSVTWDYLAFEVTTLASGSTVEVAVYADSGNVYPANSTPLAYGSASGASTGIKEVAFSFSPTAGTLYWIAMAWVSGAPTMRAFNSAMTLSTGANSSDLIQGTHRVSVGAQPSGTSLASYSWPTTRTTSNSTDWLVQIAARCT